MISKSLLDCLRISQSSTRPKLCLTSLGFREFVGLSTSSQQIFYGFCDRLSGTSRSTYLSSCISSLPLSDYPNITKTTFYKSRRELVSKEFIYELPLGFNGSSKQQYIISPLMYHYMYSEHYKELHATFGLQVDETKGKFPVPLVRKF